MTHKPIQIKHLGLSFSHKMCFSEFSARILYGDRIAIIGRNGSGKSTLLNMIAGKIAPSDGAIYCPDDLSMSFVPQLSDLNETNNSASGGEQFNKALTIALKNAPNVLLLDEPTNHLDINNRRGLWHLLRHYPGTLLIATHDSELIQTCTEQLWHIHDEKITVFNGQLNDYQTALYHQRQQLETNLSQLKRQQKNCHHDLMQEQQRAAKSRAKGEKSIAQHKWPTVKSAAKAGRATITSGQNKARLHLHKQQIMQARANLFLAEIINPTFSIDAATIHDRTILKINAATVGYQDMPSILCDIHFSLRSAQRIAVQGANGSGKSTFIKAIMDNENIERSGDWLTPQQDQIGYLDQHYASLDTSKTVFETIAEVVPSWTYQQVRQHLMTFLFRQNEAVNALVSTLSGGEKAKLCLAQIAAKTPTLLILDEITNNIDLETKTHVIEVLQNYPGALIIISHDNGFLQQLQITDYYLIDNKTIQRLTSD